MDSQQVRDVFLRWGELVALRTHHLNPAAATLTVRDVYVEVSKKNPPRGTG